MNMKESPSATGPIPMEDNHNIRSFTLNPEFSATKKGCFVIKKLHIICILAVILTIGIILTLHQKYRQSKDSEPSLGPTPTELIIEQYVPTNTAIETVFEPVNKIVQTTESWNPTTDMSLEDISAMKHLIQPLAYKIYITVPMGSKTNEFEQSYFHGNVSIILRTKEEINYLLIAASDLRIAKMSLRSFDEINNEFYPISVDSYDADQGMLVLHVAKTIRPNIKYLLCIEYTGDVQNHLPYGLFEISNTIATGEKRKLIATNTNVPFARTIFPCFDLPTQTSSYELNVCRDMSMSTETTGPYKRATMDGTRSCIWEHFKSTGNMPLHFFGFVISDYTFERKSISKGRQFTVWTPYKTFLEIVYALDMGPKIIDIIEDYFGVDMPTNHIDIYPIPSIFPYMSSKLGIIMIEESKILLQYYDTSEAQKERIIETMASHLLEQWTGIINFPNVEDNWLEESIVQYLQFIITNLVQPKWNVMEKFLANIHQTEMDTDIINSHKKPLNLKYIKHIKKMNKHTPLFPISATSVFSSYTTFSRITREHTEQTEIIPEIYSELFHRKSLDKGVCIFRMIHHMITDSVFKTSLQRFLEMSKIKTVTADDLWNIMTTEAKNAEIKGYELIPPGASLKLIISDWIYNREYPIIKVDRDYTKNSVAFTQFLDISDKLGGKLFRNLPFSYTTQSEKSFSSTAPKFWMRNLKRVEKRNITSLTEDTWLLVNPKQTYLYRVNYDDKNWNMLKKGLERGEFPADVRAQLLNDALFLARRGLLSYDFTMNLTKSLLVLGEKEYIVWNTVLHHFEYMRSIINIDSNELYERQRNLFKEFVRDTIHPMYTGIMSIRGSKKNYILEEPSETEHDQLLLQSKVHLWACDVELDKCLTQSRLDFNEWRNDPDPNNRLINSNLRYTTICNAMRTADENDFEFLYKVYTTTPSKHPNKFIYLKSLYCYKKISQVLPKILQLTLLNDFSLEHLHEVSNIWEALIEHPIASTAPFDYMLMYWKSILKTLSGFIPIMRNIIEGATINIHNENQLYELLNLKDSIRSPDYIQIYEILHIAIKHVQNRIRWMNKEMPHFLAWLEKTRKESN